MVSQATVSVSTGVVNALICKLESLIRCEVRKLKDIEEKEVNSLKGELSSMSAVLRKSAMMKAPDVEVMEWMRQVREVSYDAEDYVDLFLHQPAPGRKQKSIFSATLLGRSSSPTRSLSFADQLRRFKERLSEANERRERYRVSVTPVPTSDTSGAVEDLDPSEVTIDPQLILMQHADPVGTKEPTHVLVGMLTDADDSHAKVVSIVGITGIGKTTLAMQVYRALPLQEGFHCRAFVYIGRRTSVKTVLVTIISQISRQHNNDDIATEEDAIKKLRGLLMDKRYFIVIDDVLSVSAWKAISCALPQNDLGSRIILTTRFLDVARSCSNHPSDATYEMKTLRHEDSVRLFHRRVFGWEEEEEEEKEKDCPNECCRAHHDRILGVCGGLPLSILLVASFLARTAKPEDWETVYNSTLSSMEHHHLVSEWPRKMIHISYDSLPFPIKSCFLYLSVFPKNYTVSKDRLIWRWIAEGFIAGRGENARRTGSSYFNELINRSLIKPVFVDDEEDPVGCRVHAAIHDFIVSLSSEENFVTLDDKLDSMPRDVIRRLSLNYSKQGQDNTVALRSGGMNLSQARSLTVFGGALRMPRLVNFLLLRVLDLEDAEILERRSLDHLGKLFNLKYLGLGGKGLTELPESIGDLQRLETLDMRLTSLRKLPPAAGKLQKLVRLLAQVLDDIPHGVERMQGLQELSMVSVNSLHSLSFIADLLVKLKQLRILGIKWCLKDDITGDANIQACRSSFISCLNNISKSNIQSLTIQSHEACTLDFLADSWVPPSHLHKLVLKDSSTDFPMIPRNIAKCVHLSHLEIGINLAREDDLHIISKLPALTILKLSAGGKNLVIRQGFEYLKVFWFQRREGGLGLVFETGAMPLLRKLSLNFNLSQQQQQQGSFHCGLHHLSSLQQVHATIDCQGANVTMVVSVEDAIKKEIREHGKGLIRYEFKRHNEENMIQDGAQGSD